MNKQQSGVALLTVLLLVVSITVLAGVMLVGQKLTTRKSSLLFEQDKLLHHIHAGEQLATQVIRTDQKLNDFDSLQDTWAKKIPAYSTDDGYVIELDIRDASAKFNLNNLYHDGKVDTQALASLRHLLESLNIDTSLATVILDWQDPDNEVYEDGADESILYKNDKRSIVANQPFIDINQLAELPGVTPEVFAQLKPYITAVPYVLPVNVNTADSKVIMAVVGKENAPAVQALIIKRENQPVLTQEELNNLSLVATPDGTDGSDKNQFNQNKQQNPEEQIPKENKPEESNDQANEKQSITKDKTKTKQSQQDQDKRDKDKQNKAKRIKQQKLALLAVKSGAFEVLISVKNNNHPSKTRYATCKVAKGNLVAEQPSAQIANKSANRNATDKENVQVFSTRMWAFRPVF